MGQILDMHGQTMADRLERLRADRVLDRAQTHKHCFKDDVLVLGLDHDGRVQFTTNMTDAELVWAMERLKYVLMAQLDEIAPNENDPEDRI